MTEKKEKRTASFDPEFVPGVYRHYKGGLYHALFLAKQNEVLDPTIKVVVYLSMTTGEMHTRPFRDHRFDSWTDKIRLDYGWVDRFVYVGTQPVEKQDAST